jgi:hypothetical protein
MSLFLWTVGSGLEGCGSGMVLLWARWRARKSFRVPHAGNKKRGGSERDSSIKVVNWRVVSLGECVKK